MTYRDSLPQLMGEPFVTDGGIETSLIFDHGLELPSFAAFTLLADETGTNELRRYYRPYLEIAAETGYGVVLESPTWRANPDWARVLGYTDEALAAANRAAIALMTELRAEIEGRVPAVVVSGCVGPQGDGYDPDGHMTDAEAEAYHSTQIGTFADTSADMVCAITMTYASEAVGVTRAAGSVGLPVAISFTVETDGRLPSGQPLAEAIEEVDRKTGSAPSYFMINCAHPTHFEHVLERGGGWTKRIRGLRANASTLSHAELDEAEELDAGDTVDLARRYADLRALLPDLTVLGGCCGTDQRHVAAICAAWRESM